MSVYEPDHVRPWAAVGRRRRAGWLVVALALLLPACSWKMRELDAELPVTAQSSTILAGDGTPIVTLHAEENRANVTLAEIPDHLEQAVVAIEDERFWLHHGVDLRAILRAVRVNAEEGGVAQGGSTITQQLVKTLLLNSRQTLDRKIQEAALAWQLEDRYTKERILELYLNTIYYGNGAYGVAAAANEYFGKPVDQLTVAEGALLAGVIQAPGDYDPRRNPDAAVGRRNVVLAEMAEQEYLDEAGQAAATAEPLTLVDAVPAVEERYPAGHFVEEVKQWILDDERFGETALERRQLLFAGGIQVHTTIDLGLQAAAEAAVAEVLPDAASDPEAAVVTIEPATGHVLAMVGGRDFFGTHETAKFNLAMGRGRHTGSSFKPLVLAAALEDGMSLGEVFPAPSQIHLTYGNPPRSWDPENYEGSGPGTPVNLVEATVRSYNTVYAQLILDIGVEEALDVAASMGITTPLDIEPAAVLGANDVQPLEMASAYATLANRGVRVDPVFVTRVVRNDGTILYEAEHNQERVLEADVADQVTSVLEQVISRGTGTAARLGRPAAGKTGTAQEWRNAWFCGYVPQLSTAVWIGYAGAEQLAMVPPRTSIRVTGGSYPAEIWQRYMTAATDGLEPLDFATPPPIPSTGSATTTIPGTDPTLPIIGEGQIVPSVVGFALDEARTTLRSLGFTVTVASHNDPSVRPGTVLAQAPPAGIRVTVGTAVTIVVASGGNGGRPTPVPTIPPGPGPDPDPDPDPDPGPPRSTTTTTRPRPGVTLPPFG